LAHVGTSTMPFQIGAIIDGGHRSASEAGFFGFLEVAALAISMVLISAWIDRLSPRRIALAGCLLALIANGGLSLAHGFSLQALFAIMTGVGYGCVFAATVAAAAAVAEPDRLYAIANGGALLVVVLTMSALPSARDRFGPLGVFAALAALAVFAAPWLLGLQSAPQTPSTQRVSWRVPGAAGLLFGWAAFSAGTSAVYAFSERIGVALQLPPNQIALVLSSGLVVGVLGTAAAAVLGAAVNRPLVLVTGLCGTAIACLVLGLASGLIGFTTGVLMYWIFYMFLYSYLLGTAAVLDPTGRVGTLGAGLERLGFALGAGAGGLLAGHTSYSATGFLAFGGCMVGLFVGFPSLFRALRALRSVLPAGTPADLSLSRD
jgi:predicted MFS family arabinose efflux permease